jgi:CMP-N-acetylneuraminic acid synthetase
VIPARGGSKGLPQKNIRNLLGKPLIAYTIEQARQSQYIDRIIVSTEDARIAEISKQYGAEVPFIRPLELAGDEANIFDVLLHAMDWIEINEGYFFDISVLLHVTSPLREVKDIDNCISLLIQKEADNVFSVTESHRNPYFNMVEVTADGKVQLVKEGNYISRQAAPKVFDMNASIYVWWKDVLRKKKGIFLDKSIIYIMPRERSIDIDEELDLKIAEIFLKERMTNGPMYSDHSKA